VITTDHHRAWRTYLLY